MFAMIKISVKAIWKDEWAVYLKSSYLFLKVRIENISRGKKGLSWLTAEKLKKAVTQSKTRDTGQIGIIPNVPTSKVYQLIENIERFKQTK